MYESYKTKIIFDHQSIIKNIYSGIKGYFADKLLTSLRCRANTQFFNELDDTLLSDVLLNHYSQQVTGTAYLQQRKFKFTTYD
jgi:hypothetical protein